MSLLSNIDVAIIGAGAAGLGAAHRLQQAGRSFIVLEARNRVGGRGYTVSPAPGITFDVGCGWLHSADKNSFVGIAHQLGLELDDSRPPWEKRSFDAGFPPELRKLYFAEMEAFYARCDEAALAAQDSVASDHLEEGNRWNGLLNAVSTYINGCELDRVSVYDTDEYEDTEENWRVVKGYGTLMSAYAAPLPIAFETVVETIDHAGKRLRIKTSRGTIEADRVIVTVPTNILAEERIRFHPKLPEKVAAAAGLPLGLADKVMLALDEPDALPVDGNLRGYIDRAATGSFSLRPLGQPCIEGYFGGRFARELEDAGEGALAAEAIDEIVNVMGNDFRRRLRPLASSRWAHDPFALGSYSHALPHHADDRDTLAQPVDNRIFFAGEATSPNFFSTAHGARDSGERAAEEALGEDD